MIKSFPLLPLADEVLLPGRVLGLELPPGAFREGVVEAARKHETVVVVLARDPAVEVPAAADLHATAVMARIVETEDRGDRGTGIVVEGLYPVRITRILPRDGFALARVKTVPEKLSAPDRLAALDRELRELLRTWIGASGGTIGGPGQEPEGEPDGNFDAVETVLAGDGLPGDRAYLVATFLDLDAPTRQAILDTRDVVHRLSLVRDALCACIERGNGVGSHFRWK